MLDRVSANKTRTSPCMALIKNKTSVIPTKNHCQSHYLCINPEKSWQKSYSSNTRKRKVEFSNYTSRKNM